MPVMMTSSGAPAAFLGAPAAFLGAPAAFLGAPAAFLRALTASALGAGAFLANFARGRLGAALSVAPFLPNANGLRFEFSHRRVDGRKKVRILRLSDQLVMVIRHRHFHAVRMPLMGEDYARFGLAPPVIEQLPDLLELQLQLRRLRGSKINVTSGVSDFHGLVSDPALMGRRNFHIFTILRHSPPRNVDAFGLQSRGDVIVRQRRVKVVGQTVQGIPTGDAWSFGLRRRIDPLPTNGGLEQDHDAL